jgi:hypothetical protein
VYGLVDTPWWATASRLIYNCSTHKTPEIHRWLLRCTSPRRVPRSSWLNLVERWFGELTTKKLRRSSHATVKALADDINAWTQACVRRHVS